MLIGAAGTIVMNVLFGVASFWGLLGLFITIRGIDGYMQAFGAPGMVKINAAWFRHTERGGFAGIFGFMINLGRFGIFKLGPALLAGFVFLGMWNIPPLHWRWLFWIPAAICTVVAIGMAIFVKDAPEQAGFPAGQSRRRTRRRSARACDGCSCDDCFESGRLDYRVRLRMHRRRAPGNRSMVPAFHE